MSENTIANAPTTQVSPETLPALSLPAGVTSRIVETVSLNFHILESIPKTSDSTTRPPLVLLIHGFPELAFSWRFILPRLAAQGYYAVAFDQRGYGRTHSPDFKPIPSDTFRPLNLIRDAIILVHALGYSHVQCVVGHDFGAVTATYLVLSRPDFFSSLVLMSHPFKGVPTIPYNTDPNRSLAPPNPLPENPYAQNHDSDIHTSLANLAVPRKHYKWYYCTEPANQEMTYPTGKPLHDFLRGYFHLKSADWSHNHPHKLTSWTADQLAQLPHYYIMPRDKTMREAVAADMSQEPDSVLSKLSTTHWLTDADLAVYVAEYARNTFQGGLNWYRIQTNPVAASDAQMFAGAKFTIPTLFVAGKSDWGTYQEPGALEAMEHARSVSQGCYRGTVLVDGAGHWVTQEQPERCVEEIVKLARSV